MDRGVRLAVVGVAAGVGYTLWKKTTAAKNLVVKDFKFSKLEWSGIAGVLHLIMPVQNVSDTSLTFDGFSGMLYYKTGTQSKDLLPVTIGTKQTVKAHEIALIPVAIDISILSLAGSVWEMIKSKAWLKNAYVRGNILIGAIQIPINNRVY